MRWLEPIGNILAFRRNPLAFVQSHADRQGDVSRFRLGPMHVTLFRHPDHVERVFGQPKQLHRSAMIRVIVPLTGESILVSHGDAWKKKRLVAQPVFQPSSLAPLASPMAAIVEKHLDRWEATARKRPVDVRAGALELTLEIVSAALFGCGVEALPPDFQRNIDSVFEVLGQRAENPLSPPLWLPLPSHRRFRTAGAAVDGVVYGFVDEAIRQGGEGNGLLARLFRSSADTHGNTSRGALRDELVTYFLAGFETTASTLTWCLYELGRRPDLVERLHEEPSFSHAVISETLRLHPPAWITDFVADGDVNVGDVPLKSGAHAWVSQYLVHRHPALWDEPSTFRPERFLPEASRGRHKYAFFPFGASSRHCIGQGFALQELELAVVALARRFRWSPVGDGEVSPVCGFVLRPGSDVLCRLETRAKS